MSETKIMLVAGVARIITKSENKLPSNLKTKWLEALRSGQYKQGTGCLHGEDSYCCLGVFSKIQGRLDGAYDGIDGSGLLLSDNNPHNFLNAVEICEFGGLPCSLASINDKGATFAEIADIIEFAL